MKKTVLREYARLIVRSGVNVQKGQEVIVYADLDQPEFVAMVVDEAYKAKAKKVTVEWDYQPSKSSTAATRVFPPWARWRIGWLPGRSITARCCPAGFTSSPKIRTA